MGTRHSTVVIKNGIIKLAQYGQWDGYLSGQGLTVLDFLRNNDLKVFEEKLEYLNELDGAIHDEFLKSIGSNNGWMNATQSEQYRERFPLLSRDHGADILNLIMNIKNGDENTIHKNLEFLNDSTFCEYVYVLDLDKRKLFVHDGHYITENIIREIDFDNIPTDDEFIKIEDE